SARSASAAESARAPGGMFHTVLIANRGEIACRIAATLHELGVRSVAVYSEADRGALHTRLADEAWPIGPAEPRHSYLDVAAQLGYPVMVKAALGGGGKGMRVVRDATELAEAVDSARRVAAAAFGDGTVYLEKLIERPRHVEVQVLGDGNGGAIHLFERECS